MFNMSQDCKCRHCYHVTLALGDDLPKFTLTKLLAWMRTCSATSATFFTVV